jgi:transcriptional regulator with XRE-family HTH domain
MIENQPYNTGHTTLKENLMARMTVPPPPGAESFGKRLARLRKAAGLSQNDLARETGISQRMIAHYETNDGNPPIHTFHKLCKALEVTADQLLGLEKFSKEPSKDNRLRRRIAEIEKLPVPQRKEVSRYLETFLKAWKNTDGK